MREGNTIHFKPELYCGLKKCCHIHMCYIIFRLPFIQSESLKSHVNMIYTLLFEPKNKKKVRPSLFLDEMDNSVLYPLPML